MMPLPGLLSLLEDRYVWSMRKIQSILSRSLRAAKSHVLSVP